MRRSTRESHKRDFDWALGWNRLGLEFIGIWPRKQHFQKDSLLRELRGPILIIGMVLSLLMPEFYALWRISRDLLLVMDNVIVTIGDLLAITKLFFIWINRNEIKPMVESVRQDWKEAKKWSRQLDVMVKQAARARIFTICGYGIMLSSGVAFLTAPFFGIGIRIINNLTDPYGNERFFPLPTAYPFDAFSSPCFELMYLTQVVGTAFVVVSFSVPDFFFGALAFHASAQYEILTQKFEMLFPKDFELTKKWLLEEERTFRHMLRQSVLRHVHLIGFTASLENLFNLVILSQVICWCIVTCSLGFGIIMKLRNDSGSMPLIQIITLGGTSLNLMIHLLVYCLASEVLVHHSSGLQEGIYRSGWYLLPAKYSQNIIPVMIRANIPLQLTAGKFFSLSLDAYCTIVKTAASYISVLLAANN